MKIEAMQCYSKQRERAGKDRSDFLDEWTRYHGRTVGVERAEGFVSSKILLELRRGCPVTVDLNIPQVGGFYF